jgi:broad specificity phosphatase PhoE
MVHLSMESRMPSTTTIWLLRHGHVHNPQRILYGRLPRFRLSDRGVEEARAAGRWLADRPLAAVYASPLLRARQTAREVLAFHPRLALTLSRRLNEVLTAFQGAPGAEVDARQGDLYTGVGPPFEQPQEILRRTLAFFRKARRRHAGGEVVAVTHGDVIVFAMLWAAGFAPIPRHKAELKACGFAAGYPATGSLTGFRFHTDAAGGLPALCHPPPAFAPPYGGASAR